MKNRYKPIEGQGLRIDKLQKYVNVSISGHGIVTHRVTADILVPVPSNIVHVFGNQEGPHGRDKLLGLKSMALLRRLPRRRLLCGRAGNMEALYRRLFD